MAKIAHFDFGITDDITGAWTPMPLPPKTITVYRVATGTDFTTINYARNDGFVFDLPVALPIGEKIIVRTDVGGGRTASALTAVVADDVGGPLAQLNVASTNKYSPDTIIVETTAAELHWHYVDEPAAAARYLGVFPLNQDVDVPLATEVDRAITIRAVGVNDVSPTKQDVVDAPFVTIQSQRLTTPILSLVQQPNAKSLRVAIDNWNRYSRVREVTLHYPAGGVEIRRFIFDIDVPGFEFDELPDYFDVVRDDPVDYAKNRFLVHVRHSVESTARMPGPTYTDKVNQLKWGTESSYLDVTFGNTEANAGSPIPAPPGQVGIPPATQLAGLPGFQLRADHMRAADLWNPGILVPSPVLQHIGGRKRWADPQTFGADIWPLGVSVSDPVGPSAVGTSTIGDHFRFGALGVYRADATATEPARFHFFRSHDQSNELAVVKDDVLARIAVASINDNTDTPSAKVAKFASRIDWKVDDVVTTSAIPTAIEFYVGKGMVGGGGDEYGTRSFFLDSRLNVVTGRDNLPANATAGFLWVPQFVATPTLTVPSPNYSGWKPVAFVGNELYTHDGTRWRSLSGTTYTGEWRFSTLLTAEPGSGFFRTDNSSWDTTTNLVFSETNNDSVDVSVVFDGLVAGDQVYFQDRDDGSKWARYELTGPTADAGASRIIPVEIVGFGDLIANNQVCVVRFIAGGGGAGGGGGGVTNPAGDGTEIQFRQNATQFGAVANSAVSGSNVTLGGGLHVDNNGDASQEWWVNPTGGNLLIRGQQYSSATAPPTFDLERGRGSLVSGGATGIIADDYVGRIRFRGLVGATMTTLGVIDSQWKDGGGVSISAGATTGPGTCRVVVTKDSGLGLFSAANDHVFTVSDSGFSFSNGGTGAIYFKSGLGVFTALEIAGTVEAPVYLRATGTTPAWAAISLADLAGVLPPTRGGTGTGTAPAEGQVLIGKAGGVYIPAGLTAGPNITITPGDGIITITAASGASPDGVASELQSRDAATGAFKRVANSAVAGPNVILGGTLVLDQAGAQDQKIDLRAIAGGDTSVTLTEYKTSATPILIQFDRGRNTAGDPFPLVTQDVAAELRFRGRVGAAMIRLGSITAEWEAGYGGYIRVVAGPGPTAETSPQLMVTQNSGVGIINGTNIFNVTTGGFSFSNGLAGALYFKAAGVFGYFTALEIAGTTEAPVYLKATGTIPGWAAISATDIGAGVLPVNRGGTGTGAAPTAGQVLIGTSAGVYIPAAITGTGGITVTPGSGTISISGSGAGAFPDGVGTEIQYRNAVGGTFKAINNTAVSGANVWFGGTITIDAAGSTDQSIVFKAVTGADVSVTLTELRNTAATPILIQFDRARGAALPLQTNDVAGELRFRGLIGAAFRRLGSLTGEYSTDDGGLIRIGAGPGPTNTNYLVVTENAGVGIAAGSNTFVVNSAGFWFSHGTTGSLYYKESAVGKFVSLDIAGHTGKFLKAGSIPVWVAISATDVSGVLTVAQGGTGTGTAPTAGQLLIGTSTGTYAVAGLTAGPNINITPTSGGITISASSGPGQVLPDGTGTELQSRKVDGTAFLAVTNTAVSGANVWFGGTITVDAAGSTDQTIILKSISTGDVSAVMTEYRTPGSGATTPILIQLDRARGSAAIAANLVDNDIAGELRFRGRLGGVFSKLGSVTGEYDADEGGLIRVAGPAGGHYLLVSDLGAYVVGGTYIFSATSGGFSFSHGGTGALYYKDGLTRFVALEIAGHSGKFLKAGTLPGWSGIVAADVSGVFTVAQGGTGTGTAPTAGQLLIGMTGGTYALAGLTAGANITITPTSGGITIAAQSAASGAFPVGLGTELQARQDASNFMPVGLSSVSGSTVTLGGVLVIGGNIRFSTGTTGALYYRDAAGDFVSLPVSTTAGHVLKSNGTLPGYAAVTMAELSGVLGVTQGGTGTGSLPAAGQLLIGTTGGAYAVAGLTAGPNITITPTSGGITIAASGSAGPLLPDGVGTEIQSRDATGTAFKRVNNTAVSGANVWFGGTFTIDAAGVADQQIVLKSTVGADVSVVLTELRNTETPILIQMDRARGPASPLVDNDVAGELRFRGRVGAGFVKLGSVTGEYDIDEGGGLVRVTGGNAANYFLVSTNNAYMVAGSYIFTASPGGFSFSHGLTGALYYKDGLGRFVALANDPGKYLKAGASIPEWSAIAATDISGVFTVAQGGTGTATAPTAGQLLIGTTGGGWVPALLTSGSNVTITPGSGTITISAAGGAVGGFPDGTGTEIQSRLDGSTFKGVGLSSVSGSTMTLGGVLVIGGNIKFTTGTTGALYYRDAVGDFVSLPVSPTAGWFLKSNGTVPVYAAIAATDISGVLGVVQGGTGTGSLPAAGQLLIGTTGGGYVPAFLTQGPNITITPTSGGITIAASGSAGPLLPDGLGTEIQSRDTTGTAFKAVTNTAVSGANVWFGGTFTIDAAGSTNQTIVLKATAGTDVSVVMTEFLTPVSGATTPVLVQMDRARGTSGGPGNLIDNDVAGELRFRGRLGGTFSKLGGVTGEYDADEGGGLVRIVGGTASNYFMVSANNTYVVAGTYIFTANPAGFSFSHGNTGALYFKNGLGRFVALEVSPTAGWVLQSNGTLPVYGLVSAASISGVLPIANGGTGTGTAPTAGQVLIGTTGGGYVPALITGSAGITITPGSGTINIAGPGAATGGFPDGIGTELQSRLDGTTFKAVGSSSVSGADITLGGVLIIGGNIRFSTGTTGALYYRNASGNFVSLPVSATAGHVVKSNGTLPVYGPVLTSELSGIISIEQGGTGTLTEPESGQVLIGTSSGSYVPAFITGSSGVTVTPGSGTINISGSGGPGGTPGGSIYQVQYQNAAGQFDGITGFEVSDIDGEPNMVLGGGYFQIAAGLTANEPNIDQEFFISARTTAATRFVMRRWSNDLLGNYILFDRGGGIANSKLNIPNNAVIGEIRFGGYLGSLPPTQQAYIQGIYSSTDGGTLRMGTGSTMGAGTRIIFTHNAGLAMYDASGRYLVIGPAGVEWSHGTNGAVWIQQSGFMVPLGISGTNGYFLRSNATLPSWQPIAATDIQTGTLPITRGGTGLSITAGGSPAAGQLLIGTGSGFSLGTITQGSNITITNSAGGITISAAGGTGSNPDGIGTELQSRDSSTGGFKRVSNSGVSGATITLGGQLITDDAGSTLRKWTVGATAGGGDPFIRGEYLVDTSNPPVLDFQKARGAATDIGSGHYAGRIRFQGRLGSQRQLAVIDGQYDASETGVLRMGVGTTGATCLKLYEQSQAGRFEFSNLSYVHLGSTYFGTDYVTTFSGSLIQTHVKTLSYSGTAIAGFGMREVFQLKSSTTAARLAAAVDYRWQNATDATRSAVMSLRTVHKGQTVANERMVLGGYKDLTKGTLTDLFKVSFAAGDFLACGGEIHLLFVGKQVSGGLQLINHRRKLTFAVGHVSNNYGQFDIKEVTAAQANAGSVGLSELSHAINAETKRDFGTAITYTNGVWNEVTYKILADSTLTGLTQLSCFFHIIYHGEAEIILL